MSGNARIDAVLLIGFGGPAGGDEVRPFLDRLLSGRPVPRERYEEVVRHYQAIGGHSPYHALTVGQAKALRAALVDRGLDLPVRVGMRNWKPFIADVLGEMAQRGAQRVFGFILAPHRCAASWQAYRDAVSAAQSALGGRAPAVEYPEPWHTHPNFVEAMAERAAEAMGRLGVEERGRAELVFTAHSIPVAMAKTSRYAEEVAESARSVAERLGHRAWSAAFQSRSGSPHEPWLEPDIGAALRKLDGRPAIVVPAGFLCDHLEVLYDLDIAAQAAARAAGVRMERAGTVGAHPAFISMIAGMVAERAGR